MSCILHSLRDAVLFAQVEPTYGVPAAFTNSMFVDEVTDILPELDPVVTENLTQAGVFGSRPATVAFRLVKVKFMLAFKGPGVAYADATPGPLVAAPLHTLFVGSGMSFAIDETVTSEDVTYSLLSQNQSSIALKLLYGGMQWIIKGAYGTWKCKGKVNEKVMFEFEITGLYEEPTSSGALPVGLPFVSTIPPVYKGTALAISGFTDPAIISEFELDLKNKIGMVEDGASAKGVKCLRIVDRAPELKVNPMVENGLAVFNPYSRAETPTLSTIAFGPMGAQYNRLRFTAPKAQIMTPALIDREGLVAWDMTLALRIDAGNDELVMFTE